VALDDVRRVLLAALARPKGVQFEPRPDLAEKNYLAVGKVTAFQVCEMLNACSERHYSMSDHHVLGPRFKVHEFKPYYGDDRWYIKAYVLPTGVWFISVHPAL
jgi:hypothetical protein